jgi:hypothetical protein
VAEVSTLEKRKPLDAEGGSRTPHRGSPEEELGWNQVGSMLWNRL